MSRKNSLIVKAAQRVIGEERSKKVIKGLDIIGDIAVLKIPYELEGERFKIADALLEEAPYLHVILNQISPINGEYRTRGLEWLAGEKRMITMYKEHECVFEVDLSEIYFSPRLSGERGRVADNIRSLNRSEVILNMFAGIGSFSIVISKKCKDVKIYSIDINPSAIKLMIKNIFLNKVEYSIVGILGDASSVIKKFFLNKADRVLMPLPEKAYDYLNSAIAALRPEGGIINYQEFINADKGEDPIKLLNEKLSFRLKKLNFNFLKRRIIREVAPYRYHVGFDIEIIKK